MWRRLINLSAGASVLTSIVSAAALARSFALADAWAYQSADHAVLANVQLDRGRVFVARYRGGAFADDGRRGWEHHSGPPERIQIEVAATQFAFAVSFLGFTYMSQPSTGFRLAFVPLWAPAVVGLWPVGLLVVRRRRPPAGHCGRCGYDLRGSPDRCPECGAATAIVHPCPPTTTR